MKLKNTKSFVVSAYGNPAAKLEGTDSNDRF